MAGSGSCSCSHWWHAPVYFAAAAVLAFMAISSAVHPSANTNGLLWNDPIIRQLSLNASAALRQSGFTIIATLLQVSPEFFFLSPNTTIFSIQDSAISNFSAPDTRLGWELIRPPACKNSSATDVVSKNVNSMEWTRIIQLLSSNGFVPFAIGLHSVLDRIIGDVDRNLSFATIFTPPEFSYTAAPLPVLEKVVRFHIVPQRLTFTELAKATSLRTLVPGRVLKVTGVENFTINGVEIAQPEIFSSKKFLVHRISQVFEISELFDDA